jgi:hypothetical protein
MGIPINLPVQTAFELFLAIAFGEKAVTADEPTS